MSDIVERLLKIAEASRRNDGTLIPLGMEVIEAAEEITRLRQLLSEAETREREARAKALEEAAILADHHAGMARREAKELKNLKDYARAAQLVSEVDALLALSHCIRALQSEER